MAGLDDKFASQEPHSRASSSSNIASKRASATPASPSRRRVPSAGKGAKCGTSVSSHAPDVSCDGPDASAPVAIAADMAEASPGPLMASTEEQLAVKKAPQLASGFRAGGKKNASSTRTKNVSATKPNKKKTAASRHISSPSSLPLAAPPSPAASQRPAGPPLAQQPPVHRIHSGLEPILETSRELSSLHTGSGEHLCQLEQRPIGSVTPSVAPRASVAAAMPDSPAVVGNLHPQRRQWHQPAPSVDASAAMVSQESGAQPPQQLKPENCELDASLFVLGRKIGSGAYATVYLAHTVSPAALAMVEAEAATGGFIRASTSGRGSRSADLSGGGVTAEASGGSGGGRPSAAPLVRKCVVKKMDRIKPVKGFGGSGLEVMNEVEVMQAAGYHPNLVHFHGWYTDQQDGALCVVMGFCEGGTLAKLLKGKPGDELWEDPKAHFPEDVVMAWFCQLLLALHHLHNRHIIHRDIKPDNILMSRNFKVIKLGDLGVAKQLEPSLELAITCLGTPYYMSPEVIAARPYTYASDVWSLGCVLYEMAARRTAFESVGLPQLMFKIIRTAFEPLPMVFSRPFQSLVNTMLRADPNDRPSTKDLLQLPFVRKHMALLLGVNITPGVAISQADISAAVKCLRKGLMPSGSSAQMAPQHPQPMPSDTPCRSVAVSTPVSLSTDSVQVSATRLPTQNPNRSSGYRLTGASSTDVTPSSIIATAPPSSVVDSVDDVAIRRRRPPSGRSSVRKAEADYDNDKPQPSSANKRNGQRQRPMSGALRIPLPANAVESGGGGPLAPEPSSGAVVRRAKTVTKRTSGRASARGGDQAAAGSIHLVGGTRGRLQQWDSGAQYDLKVARLAENRFKARELEGRMMREQARQARKEKDPEHQAREIQIQAIQQHLLAVRGRKGVAAAQKDALRDVLGGTAAAVEALAMEGTGAGFVPREKLQRTPPGLAAARAAGLQYSEEDGEGEETGQDDLWILDDGEDVQGSSADLEEDVQGSSADLEEVGQGSNADHIMKQYYAENPQQPTYPTAVYPETSGILSSSFHKGSDHHPIMHREGDSEAEPANDGDGDGASVAGHPAPGGVGHNLAQMGQGDDDDGDDAPLFIETLPFATELLADDGIGLILGKDIQGPPQESVPEQVPDPDCAELKNLSQPCFSSLPDHDPPSSCPNYQTECESAPHGPRQDDQAPLSALEHTQGFLLDLDGYPVERGHVGVQDEPETISITTLQPPCVEARSGEGDLYLDPLGNIDRSHGERYGDDGDEQYSTDEQYSCDEEDVSEDQEEYDDDEEGVDDAWSEDDSEEDVKESNGGGASDSEPDGDGSDGSDGEYNMTEGSEGVVEGSDADAEDSALANEEMEAWQPLDAPPVSEPILDLEQQLASAWDGADDVMKRKILEQIWRVTVQERASSGGGPRSNEQASVDPDSDPGQGYIHRSQGDLHRSHSMDMQLDPSEASLPPMQGGLGSTQDLFIPTAASRMKSGQHHSSFKDPFSSAEPMHSIRIGNAMDRPPSVGRSDLPQQPTGKLILPPVIGGPQRPERGSATQLAMPHLSPARVSSALKSQSFTSNGTYLLGLSKEPSRPCDLNPVREPIGVQRHTASATWQRPSSADAAQTAAQLILLQSQQGMGSSEATIGHIRRRPGGLGLALAPHQQELSSVALKRLPSFDPFTGDEVFRETKGHIPSIPPPLSLGRMTSLGFAPQLGRSSNGVATRAETTDCRIDSEQPALPPPSLMESTRHFQQALALGSRHSLVNHPAIIERPIVEMDEMSSTSGLVISMQRSVVSAQIAMHGRWSDPGSSLQSTSSSSRSFITVGTSFTAHTGEYEGPEGHRQPEPLCMGKLDGEPNQGHRQLDVEPNRASFSSVSPLPREQLGSDINRASFSRASSLSHAGKGDPLCRIGILEKESSNTAREAILEGGAMMQNSDDRYRNEECATHQQSAVLSSALLPLSQLAEVTMTPELSSNSRIKDSTAVKGLPQPSDTPLSGPTFGLQGLMRQVALFKQERAAAAFRKP